MLTVNMYISRFSDGISELHEMLDDLNLSTSTASKENGDVSIEKNSYKHDLCYMTFQLSPSIDILQLLVTPQKNVVNFSVNAKVRWLRYGR